MSYFKQNRIIMLYNPFRESGCNILKNQIVYKGNDPVSNNEEENPYLSFSHLRHLPSFILNWMDQNSYHLIGIWDNQAKLIFVTKAVQTIIGYKPSELIGDQWKRLIAKEEVRNIYRHIDNHFSTDNFHITMIDHKDIPIQFEATLEKVKDDLNDTTYFVGIFKSLSNQNKAEDIMAQSEKMSVAGQLAAGIAHEIRNPLTSLKGFLQLLQSDVDQKEVYYQIMIEEIDKIEMITSELLFIAKPLTDEKKLESIYSMIKDVTLLLDSQAHLKNIQFKWSISEELYIYCDRSQIKQVLINILKNAIEAMKNPGVIEIEARLTSHKIIEIDIIDQGCGIPDALIKKIGDPFFTTKKSGTGLGLMITKQILEKQFGRLRIVRSNQDGSVFRITFPEP